MVERVMIWFYTQDPSEITTGIRDGSAHVLRCLKVWYDLPSDVLFVAINLMDRFLTKMKVIIVLREYNL
jgi:cyclin G2